MIRWPQPPKQPFLGVGLAALLLATPLGADAQMATAGPDARAPARSAHVLEGSAATADAARQARTDFFFRPPFVSFAVRAGLHRGRADSDIYDFLTDELTLERGDLDGAHVEADIGIRLGHRLEGVVSVGHARAEERSEFEDWEGDDGLPIEQVTRLETTPVTAGLKFYLHPPSQPVGSFVWVPSTFAPYVGAGAGLIRHRLEQEGEFVDFEDRAIFRDRFTSEEWGTTVHVMGGADFRVARRILVTGQARYRWGSSDLGGDFMGFEPIDLSGLQVTAGLTFRF